MASCERCGVKLGFVHFGNLCAKCRRESHEEEAQAKLALDAEREEALGRIIASRHADDAELKVFEGTADWVRLAAYERVYQAFSRSESMGEPEVGVLAAIMLTLGLDRNRIHFDDLVSPYLYSDRIQGGRTLPSIDGSQLLDGSIVFKRGEQAHYAQAAVLRELKTTRVGYVGGSRGVSFPIGHTGIRYRVGASRGHVVREQGWVPTTQGLLIVTSQRLFLHPSAAGKPLSIPLAKILSYHCFEDGLMVYKDGREKGYLFGMRKGSPAEVFGLCLGYLLRSQAAS